MNGVYEQHKGKDLNLVDKVMLEDIISDVFFAVQKENLDLTFDGELATNILVNLSGQIFSKYTKKQINLRSALTVMSCLSCDRLRVKLGYMFQLNCLNNEFGLTKECFKNFLRDLSLLLNFLSEKSIFESSPIDSVIDNCFLNLNNPSCVTERQFMQWFMTEPAVLEWLQIFYRVKMAENVNHEVNCKVCKSPVKGLRYFCLKCVNYNQCQNCFLIGAINKKHKLKHAMQEYCWQETPQQLYTQFLKSYLGRIFGLTSKIRYLPVDMPSETNELNPNDLWSKQCSSTSLDSSLVKSPRQELQSVISQIERENKLLEIEVNTLKRGDSQFEAFLDQHRSKIERQLIRLKHLKNHLSGTFGRGKMKRMQSTPLIVSRLDRQNNIVTAVNLSPILSAEPSVMTAHSGIDALSTLYCEKIGNFTCKTEPNNFSHWLGPKITSMAKNHLDGTYMEKVPNSNMDLSNKENVNGNIMESDEASTRSNPEIQLVLSDILNKHNGLLPSSPDKSSVTSSKQSSSVWLNASRDYAKNPLNEVDDKDMEELHSELDIILDQLQKLVT